MLVPPVALIGTFGATKLTQLLFPLTTVEPVSPEYRVLPLTGGLEFESVLYIVWKEMLLQAVPLVVAEIESIPTQLLPGTIGLVYL